MSAVNFQLQTLATSVCLLALSCLGSHAQNRIGTGAAERLYQEYCASCHGENLTGGSASSLVDDEWRYASSDSGLARVIRDGIPEDGMPGYRDAFSPEQIRSLVIYLREGKRFAGETAREQQSDTRDAVFSSEEGDFRLEQITDVPGTVWALSYLPDGSGLVTQQNGSLWRLVDGELRGPVKGTPEVRHRGQGGMLDIVPHPDYADNGWLYLSFSHDNAGRGMTKVVRGRLDNERWIDEEVLWEAPEELYLPTNHHFGSRFAFHDGYVYFSIGDRGREEMAQDLSRPNGKVFRLHDDGRLPSDNPFVEHENALPGIWSYGHRNPQGLARHPGTGGIWSAEHGPRGGDEVNRVERGLNYGWPRITYGMNYDGTPITDRTAAPGMEQPEHYWTPSISPCGITFYTGDAVPGWRHNLFVTGLASEELHRLVIADGEVVKDEIVLANQGRLRDVTTGPDGYLHLAVELGDGDQSVLYRLVPAER